MESLQDVGQGLSLLLSSTGRFVLSLAAMLFLAYAVFMTAVAVGSSSLALIRILGGKLHFSHGAAVPVKRLRERQSHGVRL